jgi:hypothetical protein
MERNAKVNACRELAVKAGRNISFDPERFGEGLLDCLENDLRNFLGQLPEDVRDEYEDRYIEKYKEWLYALGRCFSQAITGAGGWKPATFRRHERTNNAERAALQRLEEWCEKVIKRCNRQERLTGWAEVERLQDKLDGLVRSQEMMKAANKIVRSKNLAEIEKVDELVALGFTEEASIEILNPKYDFQSPGFAPYQLSLNLAKIKDTEAKIKRHAAMASKEDEVHTAPWGTLRIDYSDERYRFIFDGKPEQDVIDMLKKNAFKWSPANKAWQRQITPSARYAVDRIVEYLNAK